MSRRLSITLPDDVADALEEIARDAERSLSWLLTQGARRIIAAPPNDRPDRVRSERKGKR